MLAQTETKSKALFGNRNGRTDKSDGLDPQLAKLKRTYLLHFERFQISRINLTKPRGTLQRNVQSAVPRAGRMNPRMQRLVARDPVNKLSVPRH